MIRFVAGLAVIAALIIWRIVVAFFVLPMKACRWVDDKVDKLLGEG